MMKVFCGAFFKKAEQKGCLSMKIGFIGFGNMAKAIANGILKSEEVESKDICAFDISDNAKTTAKDANIAVLNSAIEIAQKAEYIFLCVKPQTFTQVLNDIKSAITNEKKILTIAAGITIANIENILGEVCVIRAMPNTPLLLGNGTVALCKNEMTKDSDYNFIKTIFESVGSVYNLPENKFNEVICVSGSTPAFVYLFAKTISEYAAEKGIEYDTAMKMFCDTMCGAADMLTKTDYSAQELIDMVSSKGGTTVAALEDFEKTGFTENLRSGLNACLNRAYELSL